LTKSLSLISRKVSHVKKEPAGESSTETLRIKISLKGLCILENTLEDRFHGIVVLFCSILELFSSFKGLFKLLEELLGILDL
jgi:hypothetical protein